MEQIEKYDILLYNWESKKDLLFNFLEEKVLSMNSKSDEDLLELNYDIEAAKKALKSIEDIGIKGLILPVKYRSQKISEVHARNLALTKLNEINRNLSHPFTELNKGHYNYYIWTFKAEKLAENGDKDDSEWKVISIDGHDGHIWTDKDFENLVSLSKLD